MLRTLINYGQKHPELEKEIATATFAHLTAESKYLKTDPVYKWVRPTLRTPVIVMSHSDESY